MDYAVKRRSRQAVPSYTAEMWSLFATPLTDVTGLIPVVERRRLRVSIARVCVVAYRGMISAKTLAERFVLRTPPPRRRLRRQAVPSRRHRPAAQHPRGRLRPLRLSRAKRPRTCAAKNRRPYANLLETLNLYLKPVHAGF